MRGKGLLGPMFGRHVGNRSSLSLAKSVGNFIYGPPPNLDLPDTGELEGWLQTGFNEFTYDRSLESGYENFPNFGFAIPLVVGNTYRMSMEIISIGGAAPELQMRVGDFTESTAYTTAGSYTEDAVAGSDSNRFFIITTDNGTSASGLKTDDAIIRNVHLIDLG